MYKDTSQNLLDTVSLVAYILQQAKSYDQDCGGNSEFIVMWDSGLNSPIRQFDITMKERFGGTFPTIIMPLFYAFADLSKNDADAAQLMDKAIDSMKKYRQMAKRSKACEMRLFSIVEALTIGFGMRATNSSRLQT
jgi:hypothetical protein